MSYTWDFFVVGVCGNLDVRARVFLGGTVHFFHDKKYFHSTLF